MNEINTLPTCWFPSLRRHWVRSGCRGHGWPEEDAGGQAELQAPPDRSLQGGHSGLLSWNRLCPGSYLRSFPRPCARRLALPNSMPPGHSPCPRPRFCSYGTAVSLNAWASHPGASLLAVRMPATFPTRRAYPVCAPVWGQRLTLGTRASRRGPLGFPAGRVV